MIGFLIVAVILVVGILVMYNRPENKSIRRAFSATGSVWDAASADKRRRLLESAGVAIEKQDALVSTAWQSLSDYVKSPLVNLQLKAEIKSNSISTNAVAGKVPEEYSTLIPGLKKTVSELASAVASRIIATFNEKTFNEILITQHHIEKDFKSGWSYQDSLSRWHALGIICLTRCLMTRPWSDALPGPFDLEVYDASLDSMWVSWGMPVAIRAKVDSFMKESFLEIKKSFVDWDNRDVFTAWFRRYGDRLIGANPSWEIRNGGTTDVLETLLKGEMVLSDMFVGPLISRAFVETGGEVLKLVNHNSLESGAELQRVLAESAWLEQSEQSPCISDIGSTEGIDKALLAKAEAGDRVAQSLIGNMYFTGEEVAQDYTQSAKWSRMAAEQGDASAQCLLGLFYNLGDGVPKDYIQSAFWYRKAAELGDASAQYSLGLQYKHGSGVSKDYAEAVLWFHKSAELGHELAQYDLGQLYANGRIVQQDYAQAAFWYRKAAEQNDGRAQSDLGAFYAEGKGVPQDHAQAAFWYQKAAEQGYKNAQAILGLFFANGRGVQQDYAQAAYWYRKAAEKGNVGAQTNLGALYVSGQGVPQNYTQAAEWFCKAAEQGDAEAQNNLGLLYSLGNGLPQDYNKALFWFYRAADQKHANALYNLGLLYSKGNGVAQNYGEAYFWLSRAAQENTGTVIGDVVKERDFMRSQCSQTQISNVEERLALWLSVHPEMRT